MNKCVLCERENIDIKKHHLIPKIKHKQKKKKYSKEQLNETIDICHQCHNQIHAIFSEKQCAEQYNSLSKLKNHPEINKFISWISKQSSYKKIKTKNKRKNK